MNLLKYILLLFIFLLYSCVSTGEVVSKHPATLKNTNPALKEVSINGLVIERNRVTGKSSSTTNVQLEKSSFNKSSSSAKFEYYKDLKTQKRIITLLEENKIISSINPKANIRFEFTHNHIYEEISLKWIGRYLTVFTFLWPLSPWFVDNGYITYNVDLKVYKDNVFIKKYTGKSRIYYRYNYLLYPESNTIFTTGKESLDPNAKYQPYLYYDKGLYWATHKALEEFIKDQETYKKLIEK